ncbi:Di-trans-poly-cis-decaprenylcistransferase-like protein [Corchorus olitorius]|uniref:Alkyl transferase n=1 Tax=Corchorus olitorius TaxID=93759 RepID=A0A1R3J6F8_9ROSI|nr:Di-trans-poly-cis-decaprenylcistransferase-like protein [Corchorus olitorius]
MLSLRFAIPTANSITYPKPKPKSAGLLQNQTEIFSSGFSFSVPKRYDCKLQAAPTDVVNGKSTSVAQELSTEELPTGLKKELMPKHVAVIMDGNGRWARQRGMPPSAGHEAGVKSLREMVELCCRWGIQVLTVFAFSAENWIRPKVEVDFLLSLFERALKSEFESFAKGGIRISIIGDSSKLPTSLQKLINEVEEATKENTRLQLIVAVSYSGKYDVVQACRSIAEKAKDGEIQIEDINESLIEQELETNCTEYPYPDLLIRTSNELRVSNFLLWQLAYTELFFVRELWPDFGKEEFVDALTSYQQRQRRYGGRHS